MKQDLPSISSNAATDAEEQIKNIKNEIESISQKNTEFKASLKSMLEVCHVF